MEHFWLEYVVLVLNKRESTMMFCMNCDQFDWSTMIFCCGHGQNLKKKRSFSVKRQWHVKISCWKGKPTLSSIDVMLCILFFLHFIHGNYFCSPKGLVCILDAGYNEEMKSVKELSSWKKHRLALLFSSSFCHIFSLK